jgi:3',5'-cyclic AMP phosphodiesterase CpdA
MYNGDPGGPTGWEQELDNLFTAVRLINKLKPRPRFVVVCGDLANAYPNGPDADPPLQAEQVADYKRAISTLDPGIACVCVCGNHDVGNREFFDPSLSPPSLSLPHPPSPPFHFLSHCFQLYCEFVIH